MITFSYVLIDGNICVVFLYNGDKIIDIYHDGLSLWEGGFSGKGIDLSPSGRVKVMEIPDQVDLI